MSYVSGLKESTANPTIRGVGSIPIYYSLEQYLPEIGDQGSTPSCVGWSTTYYALTITKRLEKGKTFSPLNPWSPYNRHQTRKFKTGCNSGCWIEDVLLILQNEGCPTYDEYDFKYCAQDSTRKIYSEKLFGWCRISNSRNQIKSALLNNFPVVVGVDIMGSYEDGSMLSSKYIDKEGILKLNMFESSSLGGGHAMCIVGYNDTLMGGSFKIVNSWGKDWGKNGFCWLRYGDLKYVSQAFYLRSNSIEARSEKEMFLTNNFNFINSTDSSIYISLAYNDNKSEMSSRGWFEVAPGGSRSINLSDRSKNDFYWMAVDYSGKPLSPECGGKCLDFFVDLHHAYEYSSSQKTDSLDKASFLNYMP
ncbi:MAG: C1 family peptidase, partial [Bacteroidota bacterium]